MHESSLLVLFYTIKGTKEHGREECFSYLWCVHGEENDYEKVFRDLVLETLNYQKWELEVLLGSGGVQGMFLNAFLCGVKHFCS
jgi:hypothetical protein